MTFRNAAWLLPDANMTEKCWQLNQKNKEKTAQIKNGLHGLGWLAQLVRAPSQYTNVAGLIPGQGTYMNQPMNA